MRPTRRDASLVSSEPRSPSGEENLQGRRSVFTEVGLDLDEVATHKDFPRPQQVRFRSKVDIHEHDGLEDDGLSDEEDDYTTISSKLTPSHSAVPPSPFPTMPRFFLLVFMLAFIIPTLHNSPFFSKSKIVPIGVKGGVIRNPDTTEEAAGIARRQTDGSNICKRWSQQSALVNGTLFLYGGRATTDASQTDNEWSMSHNSDTLFASY